MSALSSSALRLLLAVTLAFTLWVFVSYAQNPDQTISYDNVPVDIEELTPGLVIVDQEGLPRTQRPAVDISVDADEETLRNVRVSDLRVFVNLEALGPGEHNVPVNVVTTRSIRLRTAADPDYLLIRLDQEIVRTVPLTVEITGIVPFGFEARAPQITSRAQAVNAVTVRGPQGRIERVVAARARADIDRLTANYNSPRTLEPIDADGQIVAGVTVEPTTVDVLVPIISSVGIKRVPVTPSVLGTPADGYVVVGVAVTPLLVTLTGSSGPLDDVENVMTANISANGATQTFTATVALLTPRNTQLRFGEPTEATVTVTIAPIVRPFQVSLPTPVQISGLDEGLLLTFNPTLIAATLQGSSERLSALSTSQLVAVVNVRGLGPGVYELEPVLALPEGVTLAEPLPRVTVTLRVPPTATPEPSLTATPEDQEAPTPTPDDAQPTPTPAP